MLNAPIVFLAAAALAVAPQGTAEAASHAGEASPPAPQVNAPAAEASPAAPEPADVQALVQGNSAFALDLYRELAKVPGNLFFSPFSVSSALGMTYAGARTETEAEMAAALHFTLPQLRLHRAFGALAGRVAEIGAAGEVELRTANGLWLEKTYPFLDSYLELVKSCYEAELRAADFVGASEAERRGINDWAEGRTEGRIRDLLAPGTVNSITVAVLVNAIYFKGTWQDQFETGETTDAAFHASPERDVTVRMMHRTGRVGYCEDGLVQVAELPYAGCDVSMVIVLPRTPTGLAAVESALSPERVEAWVSALSERRAALSVPRFRVETGFLLNEPLQSLGMRRAFGGADFSGMTPAGAFISEVVHKAFVDVDEKGTEAAAATAVVMLKASVPESEEPVVFRADHPFLFLIRETETGSVLFMGRVSDPPPGGAE